MMDSELIWRIAGGSGDGIVSTSDNFGKAIMRSGLNVFTHRHYPSRIRGGHTYAEIRAGPTELKSRGDGYNFLLALGDSFGRNQKIDSAYYGNERIKPLTENLYDLHNGGVIVYDTGIIDIEDVPDFSEQVAENNWHVYPIDLRSIAKEEGRDIMRNTAGIGATAALLEMELAPIEALMKAAMKGPIFEQNLTILRNTYSMVADTFEFTHDIRFPSGEHNETQALVSGSHAIAYAALDEGCRFIAGYPMTPWTAAFTIMCGILPDVGGISEQVEDEIAAAALAIGASHAGVKAMSGSAGGGFSLMSEPLGLAEMVEQPIVLLEAQRAGPATGMPTKTEQADLEHVLYTSQGDSTRIVLAPGDPEEAYEQTRMAFQIAYGYNIPVILLYDQKLGAELRNIPLSFFDRDPDPSMPGTIPESDLIDAPHHPSGKYHRYNYDAKDGVSLRSIPGQKHGRFHASGNEHTQEGHISEDPINRVLQMDRRRSKIAAIRTYLDAQNVSNNTPYGPLSSPYGILTWGSNKGTVEEAVDRLNSSGTPLVKALSVSDLCPFPTQEVTSFVESVSKILVVEMNATGQFQGLVKQQLGAYGDKLYGLLKYDGNPFEPAEIVAGFEEKIMGEN
ncbi:MAG: 2-oxoacid:acceptor oxidoreductase subunit alpha [Halobacteriales archaeon]|nr:2-oxoacid:acceptor oxidoreductase subunit alpha [Halobacteriales archaeon]